MGSFERNQIVMSASLNILVIDDEPEMCELLSDVLSDHHKVSTANDGVRAWKQISKNPHEIDLVFTDINMPMLDGIGLLKRIKQLYPHIGVVLISGAADAETAVHGIKQGAYDYLSKPIKRLETIEEMVENWILDEKTRNQDDG